MLNKNRNQVPEGPKSEAGPNHETAFFTKSWVQQGRRACEPIVISILKLQYFIHAFEEVSLRFRFFEEVMKLRTPGVQSSP